MMWVCVFVCVYQFLALCLCLLVLALLLHHGQPHALLPRQPRLLCSLFRQPRSCCFQFKLSLAFLFCLACGNQLVLAARDNVQALFVVRLVRNVKDGLVVLHNSRCKQDIILAMTPFVVCQRTVTMFVAATGDPAAHSSRTTSAWLALAAKCRGRLRTCAAMQSTMSTHIIPW